MSCSLVLNRVRNLSTARAVINSCCTNTNRNINSIHINRWMSTSASATTTGGTIKSSSHTKDRILVINQLRPIEGAFKLRKRWGRGIGSDKGKNSGYGHQKSRSTPRAFEGGQTPMYKRFPKIGFFNPGRHHFETVSVGEIQDFINMGRIKVPDGNRFITMRDLIACGIITKVKEGVKLLSTGKEKVTTPIHLEVSRASKEAIKAIESVGGTVTCVHFNELALRALTKPYKFDILPRRARPPPTHMGYYLDCTNNGYLSPEIQLRNLKRFGCNTSEDMLREEHDVYMNNKRQLLKDERQKNIQKSLDSINSSKSSKV